MYAYKLGFILSGGAQEFKVACVILGCMYYSNIYIYIYYIYIYIYLYILDKHIGMTNIKNIRSRLQNQPRNTVQVNNRFYAETHTKYRNTLCVTAEFFPIKFSGNYWILKG